MKKLLWATPIAVALAALVSVQVGAQNEENLLDLVPQEQVPVNQLRAAPHESLISRAEAIALGQNVANAYGDSEATLADAVLYDYGTARTQGGGFGLNLSVGEDRQVFLVSLSGEFQPPRSPPLRSGATRPSGTLLYVIVDAPTGDVLSVKLTRPGAKKAPA